MDFLIDYPRLDSALSPSTSTAGLISYKNMDFFKLKDMKIIIASPSSDNWTLTLKIMFLKLTCSV